MTLTAEWKVLQQSTEIKLDRENCKVGNGYDPTIKGSDAANTMHSTFELVSLVMGNCVELEENTYGISGNDDFKLSFKMWETNRQAGPTLGWANWYTHTIANDTYDESVYGTNINGETVGKGAYYIKVTYTNGEIREFNKENVFDGVSKGSIVEIKPELLEGRTIDTIEVVFVYELYYEYYDGLWYKGSTNWRCSKTLNIVY